MNPVKKIELKENKNKTRLKSFYFNRYLLIRYLTAGYFFMNLYWFILLVGFRKLTAFIPLILLIYLTAVITEQVKQYNEPSNNLPYAKRFYWLQLEINLVLALITFTPIFSSFYPFVTDRGRTLVLALILVGVLGCLVIEHQIYKISNNKDGYVKHIKELEALIK
jgi:hypothetical protein